jgi:hypothetical protein
MTLQPVNRSWGSPPNRKIAGHVGYCFIFSTPGNVRGKSIGNTFATGQIGKYVRKSCSTPLSRLGIKMIKGRQESSSGGVIQTHNCRIVTCQVSACCGSLSGERRDLRGIVRLRQMSGYINRIGKHPPSLLAPKTTISLNSKNAWFIRLPLQTFTPGLSHNLTIFQQS